MKSIIFLNDQVENQKSVRQKSVFERSERSSSKFSIKLNVLCGEKNFHLTWMSILWWKCIHLGSSIIALSSIIIPMPIWVKINFSCTHYFRFQLWSRNIQKSSCLICSSRSNQNMNFRFIFSDFHDFLCEEGARKDWRPSRMAEIMWSTW